MSTISQINSTILLLQQDITDLKEQLSSSKRLSRVVLDDIATKLLEKSEQLANQFDKLHVEQEKLFTTRRNDLDRQELQIEHKLVQIQAQQTQLEIDRRALGSKSNIVGSIVTNQPPAHQQSVNPNNSSQAAIVATNDSSNDNDQQNNGGFIIKIRDQDDYIYTISSNTAHTFVDLRELLKDLIKQRIPKLHRFELYYHNHAVVPPSCSDVCINNNDIKDGKELHCKVTPELEFGTTMTIYAKTMFGRIITLHADPTDTIEALSQQIESKEGIPVLDQRLIFGGLEMNLENTIASQNLVNETTINLLLRFRR